MTIVDVDDSCSLQADSKAKSVVWRSAAAWRCFTFIRWTE